jgi:hypothetical protein
VSKIRCWLIGALAFVGCLVALSPFFWAIYRIMAFHTIPRDDYAPYLLWLLGQRGGAFPGSPYAYRVLAVFAAAPFDWMLPSLHLSDLPGSVSLPYIRATAALAALAYVSALGSAFTVSRLARRGGLTVEQAVLAGGLLFVLCWHSQIYGIDPFAILLVALLLSLLLRPVAFAALMLVSIVADEKVCMVFTIWLSLRCLLLGERELRLPWIASLGALAAYLVMVALVRVPGNAYQLQPTSYLTTIAMNLRASLSGRGLVLNVLPTALLAAVAVAGWPAAGRGQGMARRADILLIPALVLLALTVTQYFQIGRIVMHAAPIFVIPAAASISAWHQRIAHFVTAGRR